MSVFELERFASNMAARPFAPPGFLLSTMMIERVGEGIGIIFAI